jgi:hypothetical protein
MKSNYWKVHDEEETPELHDALLESPGGGVDAPS